MESNSNIQTAYVGETDLPMAGEAQDVEANSKQLLEELLREQQNTLSEDEVKQVQYLEILTDDILMQVGQLELEKQELFEKYKVLQKDKMDFFKEIGIRHNVPKGAKWTIDLDARKIEIQNVSS